MNRDQPKSLCLRHGVCPFLDIQLGEDVLHVRLHRFGIAKYRAILLFNSPKMGRLFGLRVNRAYRVGKWR
jgi:hypothetical protein